MPRYQLVIFDCDGVLVDSERITNQVFADMLGELGLAFTLEDMFERFIGRSMAQCLDEIAVLLGRPPPAYRWSRGRPMRPCLHRPRQARRTAVEQCSPDPRTNNYRP